MTGSKKLTTLAALAGVAVLTTSAQAFMVDDAKILIDRALNSPTLTIKYSGANATLIELKVNGTSLGTRQAAGKASGETNFTLDLTQLADGENAVEVLLYDKGGRLVGEQKTSITSKSGDKGPVFLVNPKVGSTIRGTIDIKVGFGKELKDSYVSFFVNNQLKSMTNNPPFSFLWDTSHENNGWHEVEAWVVTGQGETYKTSKMRVFVDNPTGRTERPIAKTTPEVPVPTSNGGIPIPGGVTKPAPVDPKVPAPMPGILLSNVVKSTPMVGVGMKATETAAAAIMMGQRNVAPSDVTVPAKTAVKTPAIKPTVAPAIKSVIEIVKVVNPPKAPKTPVTPTATPGKMITIAKGERLNLPNSSPLTILMNSRAINFDVAPRVENGIPLTPFRHLFESNGGIVDWNNISKELSAAGQGHDIWMKIGNKTAKVNKIDVELELAPYLDRGRTIVPLSFIRDSLSVDVQYDPATGHVLITSAKKN